MSLDGEQTGIFDKTLNGLSSLGDSTIGDLVVTGTLTVQGTSSFEGAINMNSNQINFLAPGTALTDAVNLGQITTIGVGVFLKLDGSDTMAGDLQMGANNISNALDVTTDSLNVTGGAGSLTLNGVAYTYPTVAPASLGQTLQNSSIVSPYTLDWTTPATPVVAVDSGTGQTDLAIMGTAPILTGSVGVVQSLYAGTIAAPSARINMDTGNISTDGDINIDGKYTTNNLITPQIHINPNLLGSSAQLKLGTTSLTTASSIVGNGNLKIDADDDMTFNIAALGSILKKLKVQSNSIDVFSINNDGAITNSFGTLTTLPNYFRQQYSWITKQNTQAAPLGSAQMIPIQPARSTQGGTNQYGVGLFTNDVDQYYALTPPPAYGGGSCVALQMPTKGIIRSCRCIAPYGANGGVVMNIRHQGGGQMSFANFQTSPSLGTFNTGGGAMPINSNMDFTMSIGSGVLPGEFGAGTYLLIELEEIYASAGFPPAGDHPPGENWYNFVMVVDVEY